MQPLLDHLLFMLRKKICFYRIPWWLDQTDRACEQQRDVLQVPRERTVLTTQPLRRSMLMRLRTRTLPLATATVHQKTRHRKRLMVTRWMLMVRVKLSKSQQSQLPCQGWKKGAMVQRMRLLRLAERRESWVLWSKVLRTQVRVLSAAFVRMLFRARCMVSVLLGTCQSP